MSLLSTLQSVGTVNASINSKAKQLETFVDNGNAEFNRHINDLASQLEQGSTEQAEMLNKLVSSQHILNEDIKESLQKTIKEGSEAINSISGSVAKIISDLDNGAAPQTLSKVAADFDSGWDQSVEKITKVVTGDASDKFIEGWMRAKVGDNLFDVCGELKRGASTAIEGIGEYKSLKQTFGGSWRNPVEAADKITTGVSQAISATQKVSNVLSNMVKAMGGKGELFGLHDVQKNAFGNSVKGLSQVAAGSMVGVASAATAIDALKRGDLKSVGEAGKTVAEGVKKVIEGGKGTADAIKNSTFINELKKKSAGQPAGWEPPITTVLDEDLQTLDNVDDAVQTQDQVNSSMATQPESSSPLTNTRSGDSSVSDDYGADLVSGINVILDGSGASLSSRCNINGVVYRLSNYSISQELLQPMLLSMTLEKENKEETENDVLFKDATKIIGLSLEVSVATIKTSQHDGESSHSRSIFFKGMIIDVSASRATASSQSASITAATWDSLLQNAPQCRSFENKTLKEIVTKVLDPYSEIEFSVNPRFKEKIPYIVQYNQSDYAFITMLASRFGEWMYNTGERLIFGEMEGIDSSAADLEYPGGSLMAYNLRQNMFPFGNVFLLPEHYQFGQSDANMTKHGLHVADGNINTWLDKAYQASQKRYSEEHIVALSSGGFDNGKDAEGAATILDYSVKIESKGAKTGLMSVSGSSKLAMLKIGQAFKICDNVQNRSGENQDVQQKVLKIVGINHSFDYSQEYSNTFIAVPMACEYPSYSNANSYAIAPSQRAKVVDNRDGQKLGRIRVQFPWQEIQDKEMKSPWIRIAVPYAGKGKGHLFVPEIGEEVMVGFEMNNAERPYVIGALYNGGEGIPDNTWAASGSKDGTTNNIKAIRTRNGHTIVFNDKGDAGLIEIYDSKNNTYHISLSADDKKITIYSAGDIAINADGSISMMAKEDVSIIANGNVSIKADQEVSIQASKVNVR